MFKIATSANDILNSMDKNLKSNQNDLSTERLNRIANDLISAANIFKKAGRINEYKEVLNIINDLSKSIIK